MVKALLEQQFPAVEVSGTADEENTGNFVVRDTDDGEVFSSYGFIATSERQQRLLARVARKFGTTAAAC